jgi:DNA-directed RNA polymerase sigma subunit (sigma70/sigma32)
MPRKNRVVSRSDGTSRDRAREGLKSLTPQEVEFIRMRFGSGGRKAHTLKEVGQKFSVTEEQIKQVEAKALRKLRKARSPQGLTWARND